MRDRMVAPDPLLELDAANTGGHRASLAAIEPAVRTPGQRVGDRMCVFHAKTAKKHLGIAVGDIVAVAIRVEEQIRRLQDEDAAVPKGNAAGEIETAQEILCS